MEILIVDDERRAREEVKRMLGKLGVTGNILEASSADEAMEKLSAAKPDVILLDIQMPGGDGFSLVSRLGPDRPPVIFTTAFEEFAARAFEEEAVDYLLKPFDETRLARALSRIAAPGGESPRLTSGDVILLKIDGECVLLPVDQIELIEATDQGTLVRWGKNSGRVNRTILRMEQKLDPDMFFRASREALVNLRSIREVKVGQDGVLSALMISGRKVVFSRRQGSLFQKNHRG